jgi:hypothetical protein
MRIRVEYNMVNIYNQKLWTFRFSNETTTPKKYLMEKSYDINKETPDDHVIEICTCHLLCEQS